MLIYESLSENLSGWEGGLAPAPVQLALSLGHQAPYLKTEERGQAHLPNLRGY